MLSTAHDIAFHGKTYRLDLAIELHLLVGDSVRALHTLDVMLAEHAETLAKRMTDLARRATAADQGEAVSINALGEVQSLGADIDRLCARRQEKVEAVQHLLFVAGLL